MKDVAIKLVRKVCPPPRLLRNAWPTRLTGRERPHSLRTRVTVDGGVFEEGQVFDRQGWGAVLFLDQTIPGADIAPAQTLSRSAPGGRSLMQLVEGGRTAHPSRLSMPRT